MSEREPALLRDPRRDEGLRSAAEHGSGQPYGEGHPPAATQGPETSHGEAPPRGDQVGARTPDDPVPAPAPVPVPAHEPVATRPRREATAVHVVGFWRRLVAAVIDLALVIPAALIITLIAIRITGVRMPPSNLRLIDIDQWIDLVLATDPALVMALVLCCAIGLVYLLVFQIAVGRTLGMRVLRLKIIDVYGDQPSPARCLARCAGYLAGVATLFLGFLWMGFDSEKRGLQDWIAGTYVIRA
jgi:uncharacterized RDD family membrane protein YckC